MAEFRNIHTHIWKDKWFCELAVDEKLLFIYLFGNERASVCGIYELPLKFIVMETGIDKNRVLEIIDTLSKAKKVYYKDDIVWVVNLRKYNDCGNSPKVQSRIAKDLEAIPDCEIKQMYQDTLSGVNNTLSEKIPDTIQYNTIHNANDGFSPDGNIKLISDTFTKETGILLHGNSKWLEAAAELEQQGITEDDVITAVQVMRQKKLNMSGLWSIVKVAISIHANGAPPDINRSRNKPRLEGL
jgi:hypothetical protein